MRNLSLYMVDTIGIIGKAYFLDRCPNDIDLSLLVDINGLASYNCSNFFQLFSVPYCIYLGDQKHPELKTLE